MVEILGPQPEQPTAGLTPEEDSQLFYLLSKIQGGRISTPVFTELARIIPTALVEGVLFRENSGTLETLLIPRPKDDILWRGMFHTPGTALRASDYFLSHDQNPLIGAFERIKGEINSEFASPPTYAGLMHRYSRRGPDVSEIYFAELFESLSSQLDHVWYPVEELASNPNFIQEQLGHVLIAAEAYYKRNT